MREYCSESIQKVYSQRNPNKSKKARLPSHMRWDSEWPRSSWTSSCEGEPLTEATPWCLAPLLFFDAMWWNMFLSQWLWVLCPSIDRPPSLTLMWVTKAGSVWEEKKRQHCKSPPARLRKRRLSLLLSHMGDQEESATATAFLKLWTEIGREAFFRLWDLWSNAETACQCTLP